MSSTDCLSQVTAAMRSYAVQLDASTLTGAQAAGAYEALGEIQRLTGAAQMLLMGRIAETKAWQGSGMGSASDWLAGATGTSVGEAAASLATAKQVRRLPAVEEALRVGRLSPSQARAVADAASVDPRAEAHLVEVAQRETHRGLRDEASRVRAAATDDADKARRAHRRRSQRSTVDREGTWNLHLQGPAADGAAFEERHRIEMDAVFHDHRRTGIRDTYDNRAYDAALRVLGIAPTSPGATDGPTKTEPCANAAAPEGTADRARETEADSSARRIPRGHNTKLIVTIAHTALLRGHAAPGETCEVAGLGPVPVGTVRELLASGDPFIAAVITKGRSVVGVAHLGRSLSAHQRTAMEACGEVRCANIACNHTVAIQMDHRRPWDDERVTDVGNIDPLCPDCHRRKTHHGDQLEPGVGRRRLVPPDHSLGRSAQRAATVADTRVVAAEPTTAGATPSYLAKGFPRRT